MRVHYKSAARETCDTNCDAELYLVTSERVLKSTLLDAIGSIPLTLTNIARPPVACDTGIKEESNIVTRCLNPDLN
jgi:hypothetical protein